MHAHTHARTHARTRARTHTYTHTRNHKPPQPPPPPTITRNTYKIYTPPQKKKSKKNLTQHLMDLMNTFSSGSVTDEKTVSWHTKQPQRSASPQGDSPVADAWSAVSGQPDMSRGTGVDPVHIWWHIQLARLIWILLHYSSLRQVIQK